MSYDTGYPNKRAKAVHGAAHLSTACVNINDLAVFSYGECVICHERTYCRVNEWDRRRGVRCRACGNPVDPCLTFRQAMAAMRASASGQKAIKPSGLLSGAARKDHSAKRAKPKRFQRRCVITNCTSEGRAAPLCSIHRDRLPSSLKDPILSLWRKASRSDEYAVNLMRKAVALANHYDKKNPISTAPANSTFHLYRHANGNLSSPIT